MARPEMKDYMRMYQQFQFVNHAEGKARCSKGLVQDLRGGSDDATLARLDSGVISALFREAQQRSRPDEVVALAERLKNTKVKLDRFQQVGVIFAHMQLDQPVSAFSVLIDLYENNHMLPERAHDQMAENFAKHASAVDESYYLLESRKAESLSVPLPAVNMIIEACAMMGDLDRAFATWAELDRFDLKPNVGTFNALLHTCVRTRELASGRRLLSRMAQDGVEPDAITYMHQTSMHIMSREEGMALNMLQSCKDAGCKPNARMYVSLVNMLCRANKYEQAQVLVDEMQEAGHRVTNSLASRVQGQGYGQGGGGRRGGGDGRS